MPAATFVMVTPDGLALMELRKDGHWCYPGGKIEDENGELVEEALAREMREEVGCTPQAWWELAITAYGRTDQIGNPDYRMYPFMVWGWEGSVAQDALNLEGTPLRWIPLTEALSTGRGSCVTPIAAATLWKLELLTRTEHGDSLARGWREPDWRDENGILRFGRGLVRVVGDDGWTP